MAPLQRLNARLNELLGEAQQIREPRRGHLALGEVRFGRGVSHRVQHLVEGGAVFGTADRVDQTRYRAG